MPTSYEHDYFTWTQEQVAFLKQNRLEMLELGHLAEEVADIGKSGQRELAIAPTRPAGNDSTTPRTASAPIAR